MEAAFFHSIPPISLAPPLHVNGEGAGAQTIRQRAPRTRGLDPDMVPEAPSSGGEVITAD